MGYGPAMDARKANPLPEPDWVEEPLTAADINACEAAEAAVARGEWVDGEVMMARLRAMVARHRVRARVARAKAGA